MGAHTLYEYFIQRKDASNFNRFSLQDVEKVFEKVELVSFHENRKVALRDTELLLSALPSGHAIGGACWKIEYNKQTILYAMDLNDKPMPITHPMKFDDFANVNLLITNAYVTPFKATKKTGVAKVFQFVSEEKLKFKIEKVLVDHEASLLIPISDKNRVLQVLMLLENIFHSNSKLHGGVRSSTPVVYFEHMSRDTLGVGRSHLGWMSF